MPQRETPLDEKQCRHCTSFSEYFKKTKELLTGEKPKEEDIPDKPSRPDCPLDKDELGNKTWGLLHTMAASFPSKPTNTDKDDMNQFFTLFSKLYPCEYCAADLREELKTDPPKLSNQKEFSQWLCELHNKINVKTGKSEFDCSTVDQRWKDGWNDGSCDY